MHIVNEVNTARHALIDFEAETGAYPTDLTVALDWWASQHDVSIQSVFEYDRGELYYWSNKDTFILSWQDPRIRSFHFSMAYTPDGAFEDPNSLAGLLAEQRDIEIEGRR